MNTPREISLREDILETLRLGHNDELGQAAIEKLADNILKVVSGHKKQPSSRPQFRTSGAYLRLIRSILNAVRGGTSRSRFLSDLFDELDEGQSANRAVFLLEGYQRIGGADLEEVRVPLAVGSKVERIEEFRKHSPELAQSGFIKSLLLDRHKLSFDLSSTLAEFPSSDNERYTGEFQTLLSSSDVWVCSIPLVASEQGEPERCIVSLYEAQSNYGNTSLPAGAHQEWNILEIVPDLFNLLQHRVRSLRDTLDEEQRRLILELAPSAITHELGTGLNLMKLGLRNMADHLEGVGEKVGETNADLLALAREMVQIKALVYSAMRTTEAFTNLERRNPSSDASFVTIIDEIEIVLRRRLQSARLRVVRSIPDGLTIKTDVRFVTHLIMNVVLNAIEAIQPIVDSQRDANEDLSEYQIAFEVDEVDGMIGITIANDGPPIPVSVAARVFEKGVTTKPLGVGHGQGLYLCRQIAMHLGGHFGFGSPPRVMPKANVVFRLDIPRSSSFDSDA